MQLSEFIQMYLIKVNTHNVLILSVLCMFCQTLKSQGTITGTGTYNSTTVGQGNDCSFSASNDYYYEFTPNTGSCGEYTFSLCNTSPSWDTRLIIYDGLDCNTASILSSNDDNCGVLSQISTALNEGQTYYIYIEGYSSSNEGAFTLDVTQPITLSNENFTIVGDGSFYNGEENCVELTSNANDQTTCAWQNDLYDFSTAFSDTFTINLGSNDAGADGMVFVIHNDPRGECACAFSGGSLGYGGGTNPINNSLAFEIDTYMNTQDRDDFLFPCVVGTCSDPDHVAFHIDGDWENPVTNAIPLMNGALEYNIENGNDHLLIVNWDGSTITCSIVSVDGLTTYATLSHSFDPLTLFGTNTPYYGMTGSTGGLSNQQTICSTPLPQGCNFNGDWIIE